MPTVTIDTSATIDPAKAATLIGAASGVFAKAAGAPAEHVHINLRTNQMMSWGSKLGGVDGNPHTAQVRVVVSQSLKADAKKAIVTGVGKLLAPYSPPPSTQFYFEAVAVENLAIDGLLLPDLIARDAGGAAPAKKEKGPAQQAKQTPEEKAAKEAAKNAEKLLKAVIKEGGKKGVEIEGASDMGGLDFFCTTIESPEGDQSLLLTAMKAMNADPDPEAEDRKGCSGHVGKMIFSAGPKQLAMVAYVPKPESNKSASKVDVVAWMETVAKAVGGKVTNKKAPAESPHGGHVAEAMVESDPDKGKFAIKDKDTAMAAAFDFLRKNGAFPEDDGDDSDDMVFGDDDNLDDY
jgi:phenylpyruvate tautomerase PptA (4-oxalocrotonate tautomerase family)